MGEPILIKKLTVEELTITCDVTMMGGGIVTDITNVGGGEGEIFAGLDTNTAQLRTLVAGAGIDITTAGDTVTITSEGASITNPAIGSGATAVANAAAYGVGATASAPRSLALGTDAAATAAGSTALGAGSRTEVINTTNIAGPIIIRRTAGVSPADAFVYWAGAVVSLATEVINLSAIATYTIGIPAGARFYPSGALVVDRGGTISTAALVSFGNESLLGVYASGVSITGESSRLAAFLDQRGATSLRVHIDSPAGSEALCRIVWQGILIQDE